LTQKAADGRGVVAVSRTGSPSALILETESATPATAISARGGWVATADGPVVKVRGIGEDTWEERLKGASPAQALAASSSGRWLASSHLDGSVIVWDTDDFTIEQIWGDPSWTKGSRRPFVVRAQALLVGEKSGEMSVLPLGQGITGRTGGWPGNGSPLRAIAVDETRGRLATIDLAGDLRVVDLTTLAAIVSVRAPGAEALAFSPDGSWLAWAGPAGRDVVPLSPPPMGQGPPPPTVRAGSTSSLPVPATSKGPAISPAPALPLSGPPPLVSSLPATATRWSSLSGGGRDGFWEVWKPDGLSGRLVDDMEFGSEGDLFVLLDGPELRVWSSRSSAALHVQPLPELAGQSDLGMAVSPDGTVVAVWGKDAASGTREGGGRVVVLEVATGIRALDRWFPAAPLCGVFERGSRRLILGFARSALAAFDLDTGQVVAVGDFVGDPRAVAAVATASVDGQDQLVFLQGDEVFEARTGAAFSPSRRLQFVSGEPGSMVLDPGGGWLAIRGDGGEVRLHALPSGKLIRVLGYGLTPLVCAPGGRILAYFASGDLVALSPVQPSRGGALTVPLRRPFGDRPRRLSLSAGGRYLAVSDGNLRIFRSDGTRLYGS
jgi:hypothetical protein